MNKKFAQFFTDLGMTVEKNNAYGIVKGYETNASISIFDNVSPYKMHISFYATDDGKRNIETALNGLALKSFNFQFTQYGITLGFNAITVNKLLATMSETLDKVYAVLAENGATGSNCCPICGKPLDPSYSRKCNINGFTVTIENDCVNSLNEAINAENQQFDNAPNNYLKGFAGALIGGLAGAALTVILYLVGYVSSICAIVAVVLGAFLYEKFQGKPNKMMIVIVTATTLVCMVASIFGKYIVAAGAAAKEVGLHANGFQAFEICMEDSAFRSAFFTDLALVLVYSAIGIGVEIYMLMKKIQRKKTIQF